jgi:hypothetical protein
MLVREYAASKMLFYMSALLQMVIIIGSKEEMEANCRKHKL